MHIFFLDSKLYISITTIN